MQACKRTFILVGPFEESDDVWYEVGSRGGATRERSLYVGSDCLQLSWVALSNSGGK